jgi:hypothetical protein
MEGSLSFAKQILTEKNDSLKASIKQLEDENAKQGKITTALTVDMSCIQKDQNSAEQSLESLKK